MLALARLYRTPLNSRSFSDWLRRSSVQRYLPNVTPVDVVLVGCIDNRTVIGTEYGVFHVELAGRQQHGRASGSRHGVQVVPPILLGGKQNSVVRAIFEGAIRRQLGK